MVCVNPFAINASIFGPALAGAVNRSGLCIRSSHRVVPANVMAVAGATLSTLTFDDTESQSPVALISSLSYFATSAISLSYDITTNARLYTPWGM